MAALLGKLDQFDPEGEKYVERLDQFFKANKLSGDDKASKWYATFHTVVGQRFCKLLCSFLAPAKQTDKTYDELVKKLTEHYSPTPSEVMQLQNLLKLTQNVLKIWLKGMNLPGNFEQFYCFSVRILYFSFGVIIYFFSFLEVLFPFA